MSNCVRCSGGLGLPGGAVAEHCVEGGDHLAHDGDDADLGLLAGGGQAVSGGVEGWVVAAGAEGGHVEDVADRPAASVDAAGSFELAAVVVVRARPTRAAICFRLMRPSSGSQAMKARTGPTPGMEVRRL